MVAYGWHRRSGPGPAGHGRDDRQWLACPAGAALCVASDSCWTGCRCRRYPRCRASVLSCASRETPTLMTGCVIPSIPGKRTVTARRAAGVGWPPLPRPRTSGPSATARARHLHLGGRIRRPLRRQRPSSGQRRSALCDAVGLFVAALRGRGLGREVTRLVLAWAFDALGAHRVQLEVLAGMAVPSTATWPAGFAGKASAGKQSSTRTGGKVSS